MSSLFSGDFTASVLLLSSVGSAERLTNIFLFELSSEVKIDVWSSEFRLLAPTLFTLDTELAFNCSCTFSFCSVFNSEKPNCFFPKFVDN